MSRLRCSTFFFYLIGRRSRGKYAAFSGTDSFAHNGDLGVASFVATTAICGKMDCLGSGCKRLVDVPELGAPIYLECLSYFFDCFQIFFAF